MDTPEYDDLLRSLVRIAAHQDTINERLTTAIERLDGAIARLDVTQARIETLLARMLRQDQNGRDA
jgi:hypothetical protein